jgi:hypothetical protein
MTDDLVNRLRYAADRAKKEYPEVFCVSEELAYEAANRIEKLTAALARIAKYDTQAIAMDALRPGERIREKKDD